MAWTGPKVERTCPCGKVFSRTLDFIERCALEGIPIECPNCARNRTYRAPVTLRCPECQKDFTRTPEYIRARTLKGLPMTCTSCSNSIAGKEKWAGFTPETRAKIHGPGVAALIAHTASLTPTQWKERSRKGGLGNKGGTSVKRQWETVKADPEQYARACARLSHTAQDFWDSLTPDERGAHVQKVMRSKKWGVSEAGDKFIDRLAQEGIPLEVEQPIHGFIVDGLDRDRNVIVEFYGDIYHCRPTKFKDPEHYCGWLGRTVGQQWARDRKRLGVFYRFGFRVVVVWESDWSENPEHEIRRVQDALREGGTGRERQRPL